jgi:ABC-type transporter lipoprotein component MlaA/pimeloyl-ACP methyl ester carboxylesterase
MRLSRFPSTRHAGRGSAVLAAVLLGSCAAPPPPAATRAATSSPAIEPEFLKDPAEPLNRGIFAFNRGVLEGVVDPAAQIYQMIVPKPVRTSINHFTHNVMFPGRLVNEALQGRWQDAGDDSLRFLTNTTVGVAGLFDVAGRWDMPRPRADFGQTFQTWGWKPRNYVMLPVLGPSDETNAVGTAFDEVAEVWNYDALARRISYGTTFNRITESSGDLVRMIRSEADPYSVSKLAWTYMSKHGQPDWSVHGPRDLSTLQTLAVATIRLDDPEFPRKGRSYGVRIPSTGRTLPFNCWIQKKPAPLVFVNPGLGSHRLSMTTLSVAEYLYRNGFSVVTTTSVFHPEFMERASTAALPAHPPTDGADLLVALTEIDRSLEKRHPGRFTKRAMVGLSMGGFQALFLAANQSKLPPGLIRFDRHVAINSPVDLHHGISRIDEFHDAPLAWPAAERQNRVNNAVHKVGGLTALPSAKFDAPPFDAVESRYLIGLTFRYTLRDVIFSSQSRHSLGVLGSPLSSWQREHAYEEIMDFSYRDYVTRFVFPHFKARGVSQADFKRFGTLRTSGSTLRTSRDAMVITNRNDFLLPPGDLAWLQRTFGPSRLRVFPDGGHLGNLASPQVREALVGFLADLR